jgi:hypothetical protein
MALTPKMVAIDKSRSKPVMRETKVRPETVKADFSKFTIGEV